MHIMYPIFTPPAQSNKINIGFLSSKHYCLASLNWNRYQEWCKTQLLRRSTLSPKWTHAILSDLVLYKLKHPLSLHATFLRTISLPMKSAFSSACNRNNGHLHFTPTWNKSLCEQDTNLKQLHIIILYI